MTIQEIIFGGSGLLIALTMIELAPIKVNPWSAIRKALKKTAAAFGRAINADVMNELAEVKTVQKETRERLDKHIKIDDERNADEHRRKILHFNNELLRDIPHSEEDFIEALSEIDFYEDYCREHPDYKNNRAVHAIANIERCYDERLVKKDFLDVRR